MGTEKRLNGANDKLINFESAELRSGETAKQRNG